MIFYWPWGYSHNLGTSLNTEWCKKQTSKQNYDTMEICEKGSQTYAVLDHQARKKETTKEIYELLEQKPTCRPRSTEYLDPSHSCFAPDESYPESLSLYEQLNQNLDW